MQGGMVVTARTAAAALVLLAMAGCHRQEAPPVELRQQVAADYYTESHEEAIRIGIGAVITPKAGLVYYRRLGDYIGRKLERPVAAFDRRTYREIDDLLRQGKLDLAFVCSGPYVHGRDTYGLRLLAVPQVAGKRTYNSYIIVHRDSLAKSMDDLAGRRFAFTDPLSNSGYMFPTYMLAQQGRDPEFFFSEVVFTSAHDRSIRAVAQGEVDGAAVDSLIWDYMNRKQPEVTSMTRIVEVSPPYGIPPVVVPPGVDPPLRRALKKLLLSMHTDPEGREILGEMNIEKFTAGREEDYRSVEKMQAWMAGREGGR